MANLKWETGEQRFKFLGVQENINHFRDQKAANKFGSNFRN